MPSRRLLLLLALLLTMLPGCGSKPDTLAETGYDQHEMDGASARVRREVGWFLGEMGSGNGSDWSVKVPVADGGKVEHFWLTNIIYRDGKFTGLIGNNPGVVS